jgi:hypothetical protein
VITRPKKYTTRDSSRPGAGVYHFKKDLPELHETIGDINVTEEEVQRIQDRLGIEVEGKSLDLNTLGEIERFVEEGNTLDEWNLEMDTSESSVLDVIYRKTKGWYATDGSEILEAVETSDITSNTGNPQNLVKVMRWVNEQRPDIMPVMVYVLPPHPAQFVSAARTLTRDGVNQPTEKLLSATRQTDEVGILAELLERRELRTDDLVIVENSELLEDPEKTGKVKTLAGKQLAESLLGKFLD